MDQETKNCQNCKQNFVIEPDDFAFYEKMKVPAPNICPECRFKRRALFRNEMSLYNRTCAKCDKRILTMYASLSPYTVYCIECYDSDAWDPFSYGVEYDLQIPFYEQFGALMRAVPKRAVGITSGQGPNVNSDYVNFAAAVKNCYLLFNTSLCEDSLYSRGLGYCKEVMDMYFGINDELCYEGVNVNKSNRVIFGHNVNASFDSMFLLNASGCQNCFGSVNVRNKSNLWFNEEITKEEYSKRLAAVKGSYSGMLKMRAKFEEHVLQYPHRENNNIKTVDSVGDYLFECKNVKNSFEVTKGENCRYLFSSKQIKDSYDTLGHGYDSELLLDCCATGLSANVIGTFWAESSKNIRYSFFVRNCSDCFGCDGIKNGNYCLLNKKYSKEEYEALTESIRNQMIAAGEFGIFMPPSVAPFAYNETVAQDNMPMTKEEALKAGYRWQDNLQHTTGKETMKTQDIPDHIKDVSDTITNEILACITCDRNYKIISSELLLYRKMVLPIPRNCFYCRHADRIKRRGPFTLYDRTCAKCSKNIKTSYAPDRKEIIYCEQCYQQEVV